MELSRITFPSLFFFSFSALFMAVLNVKGRFFISAVSSSLINLTMIALPFLLDMDDSYALSLGLLLGVILQSLLLFLISGEFPSKPEFSHPSLGTFRKLLIPVFLSYGFTEINLFFITFISSFFMEGAFSYLNYAFRLFHLPVALVGVALSTVAITDFSRMDVKRSAKHLAYILNLSLCISLPVLAFFFFFSEDVVRIVYERGNFTPEDTSTTSKLLSLYSLSLPFVVISKSLTSYLFAMKDTSTANRSFAIGTFSDMLFASLFAFTIGFETIVLGNLFASVIRVGYILRRINFHLGKLNWYLILTLGLLSLALNMKLGMLTALFANALILGSIVLLIKAGYCRAS